MPTLYFMIREAAERIQKRMTYNQITDYIAKKYPETNLDAVRALIRAYTVNNQKRIIGYPENHRPSDDPKRRSEYYDILYQPDVQIPEFELYDPTIHGLWIIARTKKSKENTLGLEVKMVQHKIQPLIRSGSAVPRQKNLSGNEIQALIKSFRGFMTTQKGVKAIKRRRIDEPKQIKSLLDLAKVAVKHNDWKELLRLTYYGVLPSRKRKKEFGYEGPSAPSGTRDMLSKLRKQANYSEKRIREQARRIIEIMDNARAGRVESVIDKLADLEIAGYSWGIKLGQITPSLFALNEELFIVNKRTKTSFRRMSKSVLGLAQTLPTQLSKYQDALDKISKFQTNLASSFDFGEVLDKHWLNLFCSMAYKWEFKQSYTYITLARQMNPKRRRQVELAAMKYAIDQEESMARKCTDVSSTESFDILSEDKSGGDLMYIEVKGHSGDNRTAELTYNEYKVALKERQRYILYIVYNLDTSNPQHRRIVDPISNMDVEERFTPSYRLK